MNTYANQLNALGDSTRRAILDRLLVGPLPVGQLARHFPVSRPAISQHLRILKEARLVTDRAVGTRRVYQIDPAGLESLRRYFDRFWTDALAAFAKAAEQSPPSGAPASHGKQSRHRVKDHHGQGRRRSGV